MKMVAKVFAVLVVTVGLSIFAAARIEAVGIITGPLTEWGTEASASIADCPSFCTNFNVSSFETNPLQTSASAINSEVRGSAEAAANLTGGFSVPILKAKGDANPSSKGALSSAFGSQGYTYNGPATTLTLDVTLSGTLEDPGATSRGGIRATVVVFEVPNYLFLADLGTLIFEAGATPVQQIGALGDAQIDLQLLDTGSINETQSVSFDATDGDQFYIWSFLSIDAISSSTTAGSADAFNTLTTSFTDPTGLTPASGAVPAPATLSLLACGLLAIGVLRRQR